MILQIPTIPAEHNRELHVTASCNLRSSSNAEIKKWQISGAKAHLCDLLSNNKQHSYWYDPQAKVYDDNRALFHLNKYENFCNNLQSLKKAITLEQDGVTLMKLRWNVNQLPYQGHHYQDTITHFMIKVRQRSDFVSACD